MIQVGNRKQLVSYLVITVLAVVVVGFGLYYFYQESQRASLEIKVDGQGITLK